MAAPSFADIVSNGQESTPNPDKLVFPAAYHKLFSSGEASLIHPTTKKAGKPALLLSEEEQQALVAPLKFTLVAKFQSRHPKLDFVREALGSQRFKGSWNVGQLDGRHLLIRFTLEEDYALLFSRRISTLANAHVKILKWTPEFDYKKEPPIVPVWIKFPGLKFHYFNQKVLYSLASAFGRPLKLDQATFQLTRPSCARVLVELDISIGHSDVIWIGSNTQGYWQEVVFEGVPYYCRRCSIFGHRLQDCYIAHPELRNLHTQTIPPSQDTGNGIDEQLCALDQPYTKSSAPPNANLPQLPTAPENIHTPNHLLTKVDDQILPPLHLSPANNPPSFQLMSPPSKDHQSPALSKGKRQISFSPISKALNDTWEAVQQGAKCQEPHHVSDTDSGNLSDSEHPPGFIAGSSKIIPPHGNCPEIEDNTKDWGMEMREDPNMAFDDNNSNFSTDSLQKISDQINEGWKVKVGKRGRVKGSRELKSLMKEAQQYGHNSPTKARRKGYLSQ